MLKDGKELRVYYNITNANDVAYPSAWPGTTVCYTVDGGRSWHRKLDTVFEENPLEKGKASLSWYHTHVKGEQAPRFAFFEPYTYAMHLSLIDRCSATKGVTVSTIGRSLEG